MLELSGIGDPEVLKAAGVECLVKLPSVGNDFQEHSLNLVSYELAEGQMSGDSLQRPEVMEMAQKALMETGGGPLTNVACVQGFFPGKWFLEDGEMDEIIKSIEEIQGGTEFHRKQRKQIIDHIKSDTSANLQFVLVPITADIENGIQDQSKLFTPPDFNGPDKVVFALCLQYPVARGSVHIKSSDPFEHPDIDPDYIGHEADVAMLGAGLKFVDKMANAPALKGKLGKRLWPDPSVDLSDKDTRRKCVQEYVMVSTSPSTA